MYIGNIMSYIIKKYIKIYLSEFFFINFFIYSMFKSFILKNKLLCKIKIGISNKNFNESVTEYQISG